MTLYSHYHKHSHSEKVDNYYRRADALEKFDVVILSGFVADVPTEQLTAESYCLEQVDLKGPWEEIVDAYEPVWHGYAQGDILICKHPSGHYRS